MDGFDIPLLDREWSISGQHRQFSATSLVPGVTRRLRSTWFRYEVYTVQADNAREHYNATLQQLTRRDDPLRMPIEVIIARRDMDRRRFVHVTGREREIAESLLISYVSRIVSREGSGLTFT